MTSNSKLLEASVKGDLEEMKELLRDHPDEINLQGWYAKAPLHYASYLGFAAAVDMLLEHPQVQVNVKDQDGMTPLMFAAMEDHTSIVVKLLDHFPTKVNETNNFGATALMYAANYGRTTVVKKLLQHPFIDVFVVDNNGRNALNYAWKKGHYQIWNLLKQWQEVSQSVYSLFQLLNAAKEGDDFFVEKFVVGTNYYPKANENMYQLINQADADGFTALHLASLKGHTYIVEKLLQHPAIEVNRAEAKKGRTALMLAASFGHLSVVQKLMDRPDINANNVDCDGRTALASANLCGQMEVALYLSKKTEGFTCTS